MPASTGASLVGVTLMRPVSEALEPVALIAVTVKTRTGEVTGLSEVALNATWRAMSVTTASVTLEPKTRTLSMYSDAPAARPPEKS